LFVVCPSVCYENLPFSIIESFLFSKPVIGAEIAGIPELVINEQTGLLFESGNAEHLAEKVNYLWNNPQLAKEFGQQAREHAYQMVNYNTHWQNLQSVFNQILL
jgi:glycosyltransferase involved in cell wall biosynthesis